MLEITKVASSCFKLQKKTSLTFLRHTALRANYTSGISGEVREEMLYSANWLLAQYAYTLAWSRTDGQRLPSHMVDDGQGPLHILRVQPSDAGTYRCTGSNQYSVATDEAVLDIGC